MEQQTGSKLGKEFIKAVYCHSAYVTSMQNTSRGMPGWMNHNLESRLQEKYIQTQIFRRYHLKGRKQRGTKEPPDEGERESEKAGLKLHIQKMKITASGPIT